jgi:hypothetical protein
MAKIRYIVPALLSGAVSLYALAAFSGQIASPAPQTITLNAAPIDLAVKQAPNRHVSMKYLPRRFANPTLLGKVKAELAAEAKSASPAKSQHGGKPTPKPSPSPSSSPTSTPSPAPISQGVTSPAPITAEFAGMNLYDGGGYVPPDTTLGAGGSFVLEAVNAMGAVYDTSGNLLVNLATTACTTDSSIDSVSDPRVEFDSLSGRWFISTMTFAPIGDASWNLLFSSGDDPTTANWYCLIVSTSGVKNPDGSTGNFPDFPKLGINYDKVVLTGDAFSQVTSRHGAASYKFQGTEFIVINKNDLTTLAANPRAAFYPPNQGDFAIEPAQELTPNSQNDTLYMAAVNSGVSSTANLDVWEITGVPGVSALAAAKTSLGIDTISYPPNAQQEGTTATIDTNDDSLLDAAYRDGNPGSLWVAANDACTPKGDNATRSCARFIHIAIGSAGIAVDQDFDYGDVGTYYYYPSVRSDSGGDMFSAFTGSSTSSYASAYAALQTYGSVNVLTNLSIFQAGDAPYTISPPRWGDYSGAGVDPDDASVWLGAEYATSIPFLGSYWGTAIAHAGP